VDSLPPQLEAALAELPIEVARIGERITSDATSELEDYKTARRHSIEAFDHAYFVDLLKRSGGNVSEASRLSGMDRSNLRRALAKAGLRAIPPSDDEPEPSELSS
jgi:transcriptional regulator of acetoin/glycerol metabolism